MGIEKLGEFTNYCQEHPDNNELRGDVEFAERWMDFSDRLERQYGGHGQGMDEWVGEAYQRMTATGEEIDGDRLARVHELVTRFWEHGDSFNTWFQSTVAVDGDQGQI